MTRQRPLIVWLIAVLTGLLLLPSLTLLFIPDAVIQQALTRTLAGQGVTLKTDTITTALPFGINASGLALGDATATWLTLKQASLQLRLLALATGKISCAVTARIGTSGTLDGTITLLPHLHGDLQVNNLELADIPLLASASGGTVKGTASAHVSFPVPRSSGAEGTARLLIRHIQLQGVKISNIPLPEAHFPELRGMVTIKGQTVTIDNLALQGNGIYLRLGGTVPFSAGSSLNLNLELMPSVEFMEQQKSVFLFMSLYQLSPGHYKLPIAGTLTNPRLAGR